MILGETPAGCDKPAPALVALLAAGVLLGSLGGGSEAARAATCIGEACDYGSRCLQDIQAGSELAAHDVHPVSNAVNPVEPDEAPVLDSSGTESMAPLLYLTPRVASILHHVFGDDEDADDRPDSAGRPTSDAEAAPLVTADEQQEVALPPVAGTETSPSATEAYEPLTVPNNAILPKFQRQMYRTDI